MLAGLPAPPRTVQGLLSALCAQPMYVYVCVCMYVCMYVCIYTHACMQTYKYTCTCWARRTRSSVKAVGRKSTSAFCAVSTYIIIQIYVCMYVCMSVCLSVCLSVCMYTLTHIQTSTVCMPDPVLMVT